MRFFNTSMGDEVFARLEPADKLINFIASGPNLTGEGIERLTSDRLRVLFLSDTNADDHSLRHAARFPLDHVRLNNTRVTSGVLRHFTSRLPLTTLMLDNTAVSDAGFSEISRLTNLDTLSLSRHRPRRSSLPRSSCTPDSR